MSTVARPTERISDTCRRIDTVLKRSHGSVDTCELFRQLRSHDAWGILESGKAGHYSYVAGGCVADCTVSYDGVLNASFDGQPLQLDAEGDLFARIESFFRSIRHTPALPSNDFLCGGIGYVSYDAVRTVELIPEHADRDLNLPLASFRIPAWSIQVDSSNNLVTVRVHSPRSPDDVDTSRGAQELLERLSDLTQGCIQQASRRTSSADDIDGLDRFSSTPPSRRGINDSAIADESMSKREFERAVQTAIDYIHAGDIFQVNLSIRFRSEFHGDPVDLYERLRTLNPSPYMTFICHRDVIIVGSSPELLLQVRGRSVLTRPIAGTRKRGANEEEDERLAEELLGSEKERAEHLMLVDLERNDIGRVAQYGTVSVPRFMDVEKYSHVIHIVSDVVGVLRDDVSSFDAFRALFPGGTITGAPKIRAMEIIDELEPVQRNIYTGSVGWIDLNGDLAMNIAIRTILLHGGNAYIQAGAGIVAESVPEYEHRESLRKAEAALNVLTDTERE